MPDIVYFRVVVGYDDLVYTTASGFEIILQHGQSWTFECRYKLNSWGNDTSLVPGVPRENPEVIGWDEIKFDFNFFADDTFNKVGVKTLINFSIKILLFRQLNGQSSI